MRNLLRFIVNNQFLLFFLLLETTSFIIVIRNNHYPEMRYINFAQNINGSVSKEKENLLQYLSLNEVNMQLSLENAELKNKLEKLESNKNTELVVAKKDSAKQVHFGYISALVINNSVNKQYNYLTLDKGSADGIKPEMAVVTPNGVVGVVERVSDHYALVISLLNKHLKVSAKFKKNNFWGSFEWSGRSYQQAYLNDIPLHVNVSIGDTIVTSGLSTIFPEGIPLGFVTEYAIKSGTFFDINLNIANDFRSIRYVYVVANYLKDEQKLLEITSQHD